ncbi:MAG: protein kinase [Candidatus Hydrogenedentes bacterium]|nr:protein kinase [Candidatus Hydrogenedentota bacterium]
MGERAVSQQNGADESGADRVFLSAGDNATEWEVSARLAQEHQAVALEPGEVVAGRFEVIECLGRGGMGVVYRVRDRDLHGEERALKVMLPSLVGSDSATQRFLAEVAVAQKIRHDGVVAVYDLGKDEARDLRFFTMEYLRGRDLHQVLADRGGPLPVDEAVGIARQICAALAHAHAHTIHRDLKPQNIMLCPGGTVRLLDFGLAKLLSPDGVEESNTALGTAYYQAPEQGVPGAGLDHRADIYSTGVILYQMLTGSLPIGRFRRPSEIEPAVPKALDEVVLRCLEPEPGRRYGSADELARALDSAIAPRRRRWIALVAGLVLFVVLAGAALTLAPIARPVGPEPPPGQASAEPPPAPSSAVEPEPPPAAPPAPSAIEPEPSPPAPPAPSAIESSPAAASPALSVVLSLGAGVGTQVQVGESVSFRIEASAPGTALLFATDSAGDSVLLFPNVFEPDALLEPGIARTIPAPGGAHVIQAQPPAGRTVVDLYVASPPVALSLDEFDLDARIKPYAFVPQGEGVADFLHRVDLDPAALAHEQMEIEIVE